MMRPYRSLLFVPGHKGDWVEKALRARPDALILDLEDAVPAGEKEAARAVVADSIRRVRAAGHDVGLLVRPNGWTTGLAGFDLDAVVVDGLDGLLLPKVDSPEDVVRFDALVGHFERRSSIAPGTVELLATLETAPALVACDRIAAAAPRMAGLLGSTARDGDVVAALGYEWTAEGLETLYLRSRVVLGTRAAGLDYPVCGLWQELRDLDGLREFAAGNRRLGFRGQVVIHPSHVPVVNDVFAPDPAELARFAALVAAFEEAERRGDGAVVFGGEHIDAAHANRARQALAFAARLDQGADS